jgi:hypothetical protein
MFCVRLIPDPFRAQYFLDFGEQLCFLVVVMALHESIPRERVPNKCSFVLLFHVRCLLVDGVVAAQYRVVDMRHVCCARGKDICLFYRQHRYMQLRRARAGRGWRLPAS